MEVKNSIRSKTTGEMIVNDFIAGIDLVQLELLSLILNLNVVAALLFWISVAGLF